MDNTLRVALSDLEDLKAYIETGLSTTADSGCLVPVNKYHLASLGIAIKELELNPVRIEDQQRIILSELWCETWKEYGNVDDDWRKDVLSSRLDALSAAIGLNKQ